MHVCKAQVNLMWSHDDGVRSGDGSVVEAIKININDHL